MENDWFYKKTFGMLYYFLINYSVFLNQTPILAFLIEIKTTTLLIPTVIFVSAKPKNK